MIIKEKKFPKMESLSIQKLSSESQYEAYTDDGPRKSEPRSSDEDDIWVGNPPPNYNTTSTEKTLSSTDLTFISPLYTACLQWNQNSRHAGIEFVTVMTRLPQPPKKVLNLSFDFNQSIFK
ncbi:hypothetical protein TNCV_3165651 [Trichonephila clavipes]|nr:hypothetical protein TNCV_3165651 [Trichonephila clavipes]